MLRLRKQKQSSRTRTKTDNKVRRQTTKDNINHKVLLQLYTKDQLTRYIMVPPSHHKAGGAEVEAEEEEVLEPQIDSNKVHMQSLLQEACNSKIQRCSIQMPSILASTARGKDIFQCNVRCQLVNDGNS